MLALAAVILTVGHSIRAGVLPLLTTPDAAAASARKFSGIIVNLYGGVFMAMGFFSLMIVLHNGYLARRRDLAHLAERGVGADRLARGILLEGLRLGSAAGSIGAVAGSAAALWLAGTGVKVTALHKGLGIPHMGVSYPHWSVLAAIISVLVAGLMGLLAAIVPAIDAAGPLQSGSPPEERPSAR